MPNAVDVVLVTVWPDRQGDDHIQLTILECNARSETMTAVEQARRIGSIDEMQGAVCWIKCAVGGFIGAWGQGEESARARACHAR